MIRRAFGFFVVGLLVTCALRGPYAAEPAPAAPGPHLKFDSTDVSLGEVLRGQDAVATFTYHNTGDAPLRILGAKPG